jgi:hypothetical protein
MLRVTWWGFGLDIGYTDHLEVVTTYNYNTITDFNTLPITPAHANSFQSAFSSGFLETDFKHIPNITVTTTDIKSSFQCMTFNWGFCYLFRSHWLETNVVSEPLASNGYFYGSTVLTLSKYATQPPPSGLHVPSSLQAYTIYASLRALPVTSMIGITFHFSGSVLMVIILQLLPLFPP